MIRSVFNSKRTWQSITLEDDGSVVGLSVQTTSKHSPAKIVDLDVCQQAVSMIFGVEILIGDEHGPHIEDKLDPPVMSGIPSISSSRRVDGIINTSMEAMAATAMRSASSKTSSAFRSVNGRFLIPLSSARRKNVARSSPKAKRRSLSCRFVLFWMAFGTFRE